MLPPLLFPVALAAPAPLPSPVALAPPAPLPSPFPLPAPLPLGYGGRLPEGDAPVLTWSHADPWVLLGVVGVLLPGSMLYPAPDATTLAPGTLHVGDTLRDGPFTMTLTVSDGWRDVSDVLGFGTVIGGVLVPYELGGDGWVQRDLGRTGIVVESMATTLALTNVLKKFAARPRPFTQVDPAEFDQMGSVGAQALEEYGAYDAEGIWVYTKPDALYSWPSGHTAGAAGASFAVTTVALTSMTGRRPVDLFWYTVPTALTVTTGYARVRATKHAPTDVISGGLLGAACGVLIPLAHLRRASDGPQLGVSGEGVYVAGAW